MAKYTDEQIKKALECCSGSTCRTDCPLSSLPGPCDSVLNMHALDIINRQEAEIERLEKENNHFADIGKLHSIIKSEAIKEFAKDIKSYIDAYVVFEYAAGEQNLLDYIDNLVAEMVGESK